MVQNTTLYGAEIWQLIKRHEQQLRVVEMEFWRRTPEISRLVKVRNNKIREIMKTEENIIDEMKKNTCYGRRLPKQFLMWQSYENRESGHPRRYWKRAINDMMQSRNMQDTGKIRPSGLSLHL